MAQLRFHYDTKEDRVEIQNADISLHEMEVNIINAVDLPFAPNSQKLTYLNFVSLICLENIHCLLMKLPSPTTCS